MKNNGEIEGIFRGLSMNHCSRAAKLRADWFQNFKRRWLVGDCIGTISKTHCGGNRRITDHCGFSGGSSRRCCRIDFLRGPKEKRFVRKMLECT